jgi:hypothetical protein
MKNMITERHNIATRLIAKAISKGEYGGSIIYTDVGSDLKLTEQNLTRAEHTANKTLPSWLLPYLSNTELARASRPDIILVLPTGSNHTPHVHVQDLPPSNWDVHLIELKLCDDTRPESQLQKAEEQHRQLVAILKAQGCSKVSLHVILMGVMGTIYRSHTDIPLSKLGLDYCKAKKLTKDLNTHSIQYATKIIKTKRKLGFHQHNANGTGGVSSRNPLDPH